MTDTSKVLGLGVSDKVKAELKEKVEKLVSEGNPPPCVAVILVGDRPDSASYVRNKEATALELGIKSIVKRLPADTTEQQILDLVHQWNEDPSVHGILVQVPLPDGVDTKKVQLAVDPEKDVDGFNPIHVGSLALRGYEPSHISCTPQGCIELLKRENITIEGKHAVVIGRSNIVGIPLSLLLLRENATVTICHSKTKDIEKVVSAGDLVFAAVGSPLMVKKEWIKPGAVCVDVGINSIPDSTRKTGQRLVGDIDFDDVTQVAHKVSKVPGGVGPMTVAMLMKNTIRAAERAYKKQKQ